MLKEPKEEGTFGHDRVQAEIRQTVSDPEEVKDEMRSLLAALS